MLPASPLPLDPDTRPLPPKWTEHFDAGRGIRYYQNNAAFPPRLSCVHPAGPLIPGSDTQRHPQTARTISFAQQLYASAFGGSSGPATSIPPVLSINPNAHAESRAPGMRLNASLLVPVPSRFTNTAGANVSTGRQGPPALASSSPDASNATPASSSLPASSPPSPPDVSRVLVQHSAPGYLDLRTAPPTQTSSLPPRAHSDAPDQVFSHVVDVFSGCLNQLQLDSDHQEYIEQQDNIDEEHGIRRLTRRPTLPLYSLTAEDGLSVDADYANARGPQSMLDEEGNPIVSAIGQMSLDTEDRGRDEVRSRELVGDTVELVGEGDPHVPSVSRQITPPAFPPGVQHRAQPLPSVSPVNTAAVAIPTTSSPSLIYSPVRASGHDSSTESSTQPARRLPSVAGANAVVPDTGPGARCISGPCTLNTHAPTLSLPASPLVTPPLTSAPAGVPVPGSSQLPSSNQNLRNDASSTYARSLYSSAFSSPLQARPRTAGSASSAASTPLTSPSPSAVTHPRAYPVALPQTAVEVDTAFVSAGTHAHAQSASSTPPPLPQRRSASGTVPVDSAQPQPQSQIRNEPPSRSQAQFTAQTQSASSYRYSVSVTSPSASSISSVSSRSLLSGFWGVSRAQRKEEERRLEWERVEREKAREERERVVREGQVVREAERRRVPPPFVPRAPDAGDAPVSLYGSGLSRQLSTKVSAAGASDQVHGVQNVTTAHPSPPPPQSPQSLSPSVFPPSQIPQQQLSQQSYPQQQYLQQPQYAQQSLPQQQQQQQQQQQRGFRDTLLSTIGGRNMSSAVAGGVAGMVGGALLGAVAVAEGQDLMSGIANGLGQVVNGVDLGQLTSGVHLGQLPNGVDPIQLANGVVDLGQLTNVVDFNGLGDSVYENDNTEMGGNAFDPTDGAFDPTSGVFNPIDGTFDSTDGGYDPTDGVCSPSDGQYDPANGTYNSTDGTYDPTNGTYDLTDTTYDPSSPDDPTDGSYSPADGGYDPITGTYAPTDGSCDSSASSPHQGQDLGQQQEDGNSDQQQPQTHAAHQHQPQPHVTQQQTQQQTHVTQQQAHVAHHHQQIHATHQQTHVTQQQAHAAHQQQTQIHGIQQHTHATQQGMHFQKWMQQQIRQQTQLQQMLQTQLQLQLQQQNYSQAQATASLLANLQQQQQLQLQATLVGAGVNEIGTGSTILSQGGGSGSAPGSIDVSSMGNNVNSNSHVNQAHAQLAPISGSQQHAASTTGSGPGHLNITGRPHTQSAVGIHPPSVSVNPASYLHQYQHQLQNANQHLHQATQGQPQQSQNILQLAQPQQLAHQPQNTQLQLAQLQQLVQRPQNTQLNQLGHLQLAQQSQNAQIHQLHQDAMHTHSNSLGLSANTQQQLGRLAVNGALRVGGILLSNALTGNAGGNGVGASQ
ncbi:hypothetical protein EW145_g6723 [Phellinidium pouzarii]|uniref:WW domain-containing protein n=1 Tax=Phellinidium pouzarii TaxID=167371 RepID=A0A4V3XBM8_9AGAM|nr:hypothetical protein EW145_g6723 [Phellinidium pouzarii]